MEQLLVACREVSYDADMSYLVFSHEELELSDGGLTPVLREEQLDRRDGVVGVVVEVHLDLELLHLSRISVHSSPVKDTAFSNRRVRMSRCSVS